MRRFPTRFLKLQRLALRVLLLVSAISCDPAPPTTLSMQERELAASIGFEETAVLAAKRSGEGIRRLEAMDADGQPIAVNGLSLTLGGETIPTLKRLRQELGPLGYQVFIHSRGFGVDPDRLAIVKGTDPFAIVKLSQTDGINYDIKHEDVLARLQEWDGRFGLNILGAGLDWVEAEFVNQPPDMSAFAEEVFTFCPDVVHQGTCSVEALAKEMQSSNTLYLWWD